MLSLYLLLGCKPHRLTLAKPQGLTASRNKLDDIAQLEGLIASKQILFDGFVDMMSKIFPLVSNFCLLCLVRAHTTKTQDLSNNQQVEPALSQVNFESYSRCSIVC